MFLGNQKEFLSKTEQHEEVNFILSVFMDEGNKSPGGDIVPCSVRESQDGKPDICDAKIHTPVDYTSHSSEFRTEDSKPGLVPSIPLDFPLGRQQ